MCISYLFNLHFIDNGALNMLTFNIHATPLPQQPAHNNDDVRQNYITTFTVQLSFRKKKTLMQH